MISPKEEKEIKRFLKEIYDKLDAFAAKGLYEKWVPKKSAQRFFDYGETQMRQLEKENKIVTTKIKARKFYSLESVLSLLDSKKK
jgi:hypothetical protein